MSSRAGRGVAIGAGSLAVLLGALDMYVVVTIIRDIMRDVGIPVNQLQRITWIVTMYLLGYIAAMPLLGRASDRFGRKLLLQASLALFIVGSIVTALAGHWGDFHMLIVGRLIQGVASGALLPVTLALGADLWAQRNRAGVLGGIGAAQELGSVLGPLYGIFIVWLFHDWQYVFWINVPLTLIAMVMIQFSLPSRDRTEAPEKIDVTGGLLLALALALAVVGLYNPAPDGKQILPPYGAPLVIGALVVAVAFVIWERLARTRLIEPTGVRFRPFLASLGASLCAGAALMVTLVNVELFGQGVLQLSQTQAAGLLTWFLIALPIGAVVGGLIATRVGDRVTTFVGLMIAAYGYWLIHYWRMDVMSQKHNIFGITVPVLHADLLVAGVGLGLVIGPLTSAALRVVPSAQHGIASAAVVVARNTGMLIGIAALSAWGLFRFNQIVAHLSAQIAPDATLLERIAAQGMLYLKAFAQMYGDIFAATVAICVVGALLGLLLGSRKDHAEEPEVAVEEQTVALGER
jgi:MFS family permease